MITAGKKPERAKEFSVTLSIDERVQGAEPMRFAVPVTDNWTLDEFEEKVLNTHAVDLSNYALILMGLELKDDHASLSGLGFVPACTVHAGNSHPICRVLFDSPNIVLFCCPQSQTFTYA